MFFTNKKVWALQYLVSNLLQATTKQQLSMNWKFHIPDLKVGTLDQLVGLSDDLGKIIK